MTAPDPAYPVLHVRPPSGWVNDPNGPFRWRGRYHLFFQHNPASARHGDICWGHATSADLLRWEVEPLALRPTPGGPDRGGCWSGCVVDDAGVPTAVYSGLVEAHPETTVCLAVAEDPTDDRLQRWRAEPTPVVTPPARTEWLGFRDPFVVTVEGRRFGLVGGGVVGEGGRIEVFGCDDLRRWRRLRPLLDASDPVAAEVAAAAIWECPQLFEIDGRWVLVVSLVKDGALTRVVHLTGELEVHDDGLRFRPVTGALVDHGHDFYAPAVLVEPGRTLIWGWTWEDRPSADSDQAGWAGALTLPRALRLDPAGRLVSSPAEELQRLRRGSRTCADGTAVLTGPSELEVAGRQPFSVHLDNLTVRVDPVTGTVGTSRAVRDPARRSWPSTGPVPPGRVGVRIVVDGSVIGVYAEGGPVFTERVYPDGPRRVRVEADPPLPLTVHTLALPEEDPQR